MVIGIQHPLMSPFVDDLLAGKTHVIMGDDERAYLDYSMGIDLDYENAALWYERSWCLRR